MWAKKGKAVQPRAARAPVQWVGRYSVGGRADLDWAACAVRNIGRGGGGLLLYGGLTANEGDTLVIDIERIGSTAVSLRLRGVARHVGERDDDGAVSIGVQLVFDGPHEERIAKSLFGE